MEDGNIIPGHTAWEVLPQIQLDNNTRVGDAWSTETNVGQAPFLNYPIGVAGRSYGRKYCGSRDIEAKHKGLPEVVRLVRRQSRDFNHV